MTAYSVIAGSRLYRYLQGRVADQSQLDMIIAEIDLAIEEGARRRDYDRLYGWDALHVESSFMFHMSPQGTSYWARVISALQSGRPLIESGMVSTFNGEVPAYLEPQSPLFVPKIPKEE